MSLCEFICFCFYEGCTTLIFLNAGVVGISGSVLVFHRGRMIFHFQSYSKITVPATGVPCVPPLWFNLCKYECKLCSKPQVYVSILGCSFQTRMLTALPCCRRVHWVPPLWRQLWLVHCHDGLGGWLCHAAGEEVPPHGAGPLLPVPRCRELCKVRSLKQKAT